LLPGGKVLTTGLDARAVVWDVDTGKKARTLDGPDFICDVTPDGKRLACAGTNGRPVCIYDLRESEAMELPLAPKARVSGVPFSPDVRRFHAWGAPPATRWYLHAFDAATGRELYKVASGGGQLVVTPDGKHLIIGGTRGVFGGAEVIIREAATGRQVRPLSGH